MTPRFPEPDNEDPPPTEEARNMATFMALTGLLGIGGGLLFLVAMVMPDILYLLVIVAVFPLYFLFHYVVWGRLMSARVEEDPDDDGD